MKKKILTCILVLTLIATVSCNKKGNNSKSTDKNMNTTETISNNINPTDNGDKFIVKDGNHPKAEDFRIILSQQFENGIGKVDIENNGDYEILKFSMDYSDDKGNIVNINYAQSIPKDGYIKFVVVNSEENIDFNDFRPIYHEVEYLDRDGSTKVSKYDYDLKEYY